MASFLLPEEREFALERLSLDSPSSSIDNHGSSSRENRETFNWSEVRRGMLDIKMWFSALAYFSILSGLYSFGLFLPSIIKDSGFANNANEVQLWTVIPYAVATVVTVAVALISDWAQLRGVIILATLPISIAGYAAIANVHSAKVKYGMTFLMASGMYSSVPCILGWNSNNSAGHYKRATTSAMQLAIANCGGFVSTFNYPSKDAPQYHKGHTTILSLLVAAWFLVLFNILYCAKVNRYKKRGKYDKYIGYNDDRDPDFKLML
ncbi:hypothetical protein MPDQ_003988 [Monascus purpureus]|uniref:Major facilitator superfamily (MFS) profile domain-containing protein n=1 Tax=Monascus purpureus TaxID=5098 RepID=A0A507R1T3_MONPU|nr:hypothetical protein MPDQ_003988 [Monascus purpureus]